MSALQQLAYKGENPFKTKTKIKCQNKRERLVLKQKRKK
jgi:hypothetical protein